MRKSVWFSVFVAALLLWLGGCSSGGGSFAAVGLTDAQEATDAIMNANSAAFTACTVLDPASPAALPKVGNTAGTLFVEFSSPPSPYPRYRKYIFAGFGDPATGYTLTGSVAVTWTASMGPYSCIVDVAMSHPTKPVQRMTGTLTSNGSVASGTLTLNKDTFDVAQLTQHFFSH